ncbi:TetR/AcrR family transcriptional regulator [Gordonia jinghuaiqii]|uniref:TetR/AcrR family transcriptional regulator n=1 Tax=Gordonia jinghuaiqii TaxID=2758710 RepID=UPI002948BC6C|nr:TetR family transcriptional regulator [Gordonia jinghuaiqii]
MAAALIAKSGLDAFDIDELTRRAHCSRATVYRHAGAKGALVEAVLASTSEPVLGAIRAATTGMTGPQRARTAIVAALAAPTG